MRMRLRTVIIYFLIGLIVLILGSLTGWYFFLRSQTETITTGDTARGYGTEAPQAAANGSNASGPSESTTDARQATSVPDNGGFFSGLWSRMGGAGGATFSPAGIQFQESTGRTSDTPAAQRPPQLWQVQKKPVAGLAFIGSGKNTRLRYADRASGYIFDADPETGLVVRLTNTLLPKTYEAFFGGGHAVMRALDAEGNITTFVGTLASSTSVSGADASASALVGADLTKNIMRIAVEPVSGALFYIVRTATGVAGITSDWNGANQKRLFESAALHWNPIYLRDGRIVLTQAAADNAAGYAYELKGDGALLRLLPATAGLTVLPHTSGALLWSRSTSGAASLFVQTGTGASAAQLPIKTIAEKCAWSPEPATRTSGSVASSTGLVAYCGVPQGFVGQGFLDDWYQGASHFSDALWRVDASAGTSELVLTPPSNTPLDMAQMHADSDGRYITFVNAADKSLWVYRIEK